jgi:hypothetical protein
LLGKLNWSARVIRGGRTFVRNLINLLPLVKESYHYVRLSSAARSDIQWWLVALSKFHGQTPFGCDIPLPSFAFATDACLTGGGGHFASDWFHVNWALDVPSVVDCNINILELQTVLEAAKRWGSRWSGLHILVRSDNAATVAAVNRGTSRSVGMLSIIKQLFWLSVEFDFRLSAQHLPGRLNVLSDCLSRLDVFDSAVLAKSFL